MSIEPEPLHAVQGADVRRCIQNAKLICCADAQALLAAHDYWRARCPVVEEDVGPAHTAARVRAFALANSWTCWLTDDPNRDAASTTAEFCNKHARASGMSPHDVLAAIEAMP